MKPLKINFCDFARDFDKENNDFVGILRERFQVEISDQPDYLFYSSFGNEHLKYSSCVKIYYTGECFTPNFNLCDYAISFEHLEYGDRHIRVPLYELFQYQQKYLSLFAKDRPRFEKTDFCGFVVSNDLGMKERQQMYDLLTKYKKVDSGGRYMNNIGGPVKDKFEFDCRHKFSITFENCSNPGYTTEKIVEALAAGCIPIYLGNPEIAKEFNPKAFINVADYATLQEAVDRVIEIDSNPSLYESIMSEPIVTGAHESLDRLRDFLFHIVEQPLAEARRRPTNTRIEEEETIYGLYDRYMSMVGMKVRRFKSLIRRFKNNAL